MKKNYTILLLFGVLLMLAGCKKDNLAGIPEGALILTTEGFVGPGGTKTSVSGTTVQWDNGDTVNLYGTPYRVTVNGSQAYVENFTPPTSGDYYGYFPHNLSVGTPNQDATTVIVPSVYRCHYSGGRQIIKLPLIGKASYNANTIRFLHVTAAVKLDIKNATGVPVVLDSVVVSSASQQLSGSRGVTISVGGLTVNARQGGDLSDADRKVKVIFTDSPVIATNCTTEVQVPFLPISAGTDDLTISIYTHANIAGAAPGTRFIFSRAGSSTALARNELMTAKIALSNGDNTHPTGLFSVSDSKKVIFSQANLKYQASTSTWSFHEHQWNYIGNAVGNTTETNRSTQSDWIDLFGWGTGTGEKAILVTVSSGSYSDYTEWGTNAIVNGGNTANFGWRTLSSTEWDYLLRTRSASTVNGVADARFAIANVNSVNGLIILPDSYTHPSGVTHISNINYWNENYNSNTYNSTQWALMEAAGAVFLPTAGIREKLDVNATVALRVSNEGSQGLYWSSTVGTEGKAHRLLFDNTSHAGDFSPVNAHDCYLGCAVRLVRDANLTD